MTARARRTWLGSSVAYGKAVFVCTVLVAAAAGMILYVKVKR